MSSLAERIAVLRDEVLDTAEQGDHHARGGEIFDAIVRALMIMDATDPGLDLALHDTLSRRLAWGDDELAVLADAESVCQRLLAAAGRSLRDPQETALVAELVADVGCTAARIIALAAVGRAARERSALMREQASYAGLRTALERQDEELARLEGRDF